MSAEHNVPSTKAYAAVLVALIVGTITTVAVAQADLGHAGNVLLGLGIAVIKASLVCMIFMQLKFEQKWWAGLVIFPLVLVGIIVCSNLPDTGLNGVRQGRETKDGPFKPITQDENQYGLTTVARVWCEGCHGYLKEGEDDCKKHPHGAAGHGGANEPKDDHKK